MMTYLLGALAYVLLSLVMLASLGYSWIFNSREKRYVEMEDDEPRWVKAKDIRTNSPDVPVEPRTVKHVRRN